MTNFFAGILWQSGWNDFCCEGFVVLFLLLCQHQHSTSHMASYFRGQKLARNLNKVNSVSLLKPPHHNSNKCQRWHKRKLGYPVCSAIPHNHMLIFREDRAPEKTDQCWLYYTYSNTKSCLTYIPRWHKMQNKRQETTSQWNQLLLRGKKVYM